MSYYSQKDKKWAAEKLGACTDTLAQSACYITSGTNLAKVYGTRDTNPSKLNKWLTQNAGYSAGCLLITPKMAEYLGFKYLGKVANTNVRYCIAETDHYRKVGVPQHFFVYDNATKKRIDPLDLAPEWEANTYHVVSYRIFEPLAQAVTSDPGIATSIPVIGETSSTANIPVEIVPMAPKTTPEAPTVPEPSPRPLPTESDALREILKRLFNWLKNKLERK